MEHSLPYPPEQPVPLAEQHNLIARIQAGSTQAESAALSLLNTYRPTMITVIKAALPPPAMVQDAYQAARLGLLEAVHGFDLTRGTSFPAYARKYVQGSVLEAVYGSANTQQLGNVESLDCLALDQEPGHDDVDLDEAEGQDAVAAVRGFVRSLSPVRRQVIFDLFWRRQSQADIARRRGIGRPAVSNHLAKAYITGRVALAPYAHDAGSATA